MVKQEQLDTLLRIDSLGLVAQDKINRITGEPYVDSLGDDAIQVVVVLGDENDADDVAIADEVAEKVRNKLTEHGISEFAYFTFTTQADLDDAERGEDAA